MENHREHADERLLDEPYDKIMIFNEAYKQWMLSLKDKVPGLHDEFEYILDALYVAADRDASYPMHVFQWYTGPYISIMLQNDPQFFDEIARDSKGKSIPIAFKDHFMALESVTQNQSWQTLRFLMRLTAQVYDRTYILESS